MRMTESQKRRREFYDKLRKKWREWIKKLINILARPIELIDQWLDAPYYEGYADGSKETIDKIAKYYVGKIKVLIKSCNHIEAIISEMELQYPELHTEVQYIDKAVQDIKDLMR